MTHNRIGLNLVFTGDGKGKTTAAMGAAIRAAGQGLQVLMIQFMKGQPGIGLKKALARCNLPITVRQFGRPGFVHSRACEAIDILLAHQGLQAFKAAVEAGTYDMIILDEVNVVVDFGLLNLDDVLAVARKKPSQMHLIFTGRHAKEPLLDMADLITEMRLLKHYYDQGVVARRGIEL